MEKGNDKKRIRILAVDIDLSYNADYHTEQVNGKLRYIENNGGIVLGMESYLHDKNLRTIIAYKV